MLHIDLPSRDEIERLSGHRGAPSVSIYLETTPLTLETGTDRIELKNLLKRAVEQMQQGGIPKRSIWPIEEAVEGLVEDDFFWAEQANSLAILATPDSIQTFRLPNKLQSMVEVSDRFHLKPLLRAVTFPHTAYVLAFSIGAVRLIEVSADLPPHEVAVPKLPRNLQDALGRRRQTQSIGGQRAGKQVSEHEMFKRYARRVDEMLRPVLTGRERPLIIAAPDPMGTIYRSVSSYPHTARQIIAGNHDDTPDHELAAAARRILDEIYASEIKEVRRLYEERQGENRAMGDIAQAARAATFGAVDTLIFDIDDVVYGTIDDNGRVEFADGPSVGTYGIVDEIAARAQRSGARLLAARRPDIPGGGNLAAILRYPV